MKRSVKNLLLSGLAAGLSILTVSAQTAVNFGSLPLGFEANSDQTDGALGYTAHGAGSQFSISPTGAKFSLLKRDGTSATVNMEFIGANVGVHLSGEALLGGKVNYLVGNNPSQWRSGVSSFDRVRCDNIYPGVNVVYYGNQNQLEYDFNLAAGVNPNTIAFCLQGADNVSVDPQGELVIRVQDGKIIQHKPEIYQNVGGLRHELTGGYKLLDHDTIAFTVGQYDPALPLVIDPILAYSTYFGGTLGDFPWTAKVDGGGNLYIAGWTYSSVFSNNVGFATTNAYQTNYQHGNFLGDGFVSKFNSQGTNLWTTYLGGANGDNEVTSLALDSAGNVYLTGLTTSTSFPATSVPGIKNSLHISGSYDSYLTTYPSDAFVTELNPTGSKLIFSTYLGGSAQDAGYGITVDSTGNIYVAGITYSVDFPTNHGYFNSLRCSNTVYFNNNAFVTELAPSGAALNYSTYWGGTNVDGAMAITCTNNRVYIAGYTSSTNFPWISGFTNFGPNHLNGSTNLNNYPYDAFVTCFTVTGTTLTPLYSSSFGGTNNDFATAIAADGNGNVYTVGSTISTNFPYYTNGFLVSSNLDSYVRTNLFGGIIATNSFLTQITWNGANAAFGYSVMFGGQGGDIAHSIAMAEDGKIFITGQASSTNFPVTPGNLSGFLSPTNNNNNTGGSDAFVMALAGNSPVLLYSCYLGGIHSDFAYGIGVDANDTAYVVGQTHSYNFPTFNAQQSFLNGTNDIFLAKILMTLPVPTLALSSTATNITLSWAPTSQEIPSPFKLQASTNLASPNWITISGMTLTNGVYVFKTAPTNPAEFFRLDNF